ncbi:MAG: hypothetical protein IT492_24020 [Gammaproteobacteria bacterium]|nr:hypothetical protein [Gammaproteobacteria bacterium]
MPVSAAINDPAAGFGASMAALCDLVLISDKASLVEPHVDNGLVLDDGIAVTRL